jgi:hypothetical protein
VQRVLVVGSALVALAVAAVMAVSVGAHTGHAQAAPSGSSRGHRAARHPPALHPAPSITVPGVTGHTCYVSVPRCSEMPCVEYINAHAAVAVGVAGARLATTARCPSPNAGIVTVTRGPTRAGALANFSGALPRLVHKLRARPAGSP